MSDPGLERTPPEPAGAWVELKSPPAQAHRRIELLQQRPGRAKGGAANG